MKMSASTITRSPAQRLAWNRPPSTEGVTFSMTTRLRPSDAAGGPIASGRLEKQHAQWWQRQRERLRMTMRFARCRIHATEIADTAAAIARRIAVEHFAPAARHGHPEAMAVARDGREVADDQHDCAILGRTTQERGDAVGRVAAIDPREALGHQVAHMQS